MAIARRGNAAAFLLVFALGSSHAGENPVREGIVLAASQPALESGSDETSFNFAHLRDLWVRVNLVGMPRSLQLNLRLIDPQGTLIYEASVPYTSDPTMTTIDSPGAGHPVAVFPAKTRRSGVALDYALPVSGGVVTRYLSEGAWTLDVEAGGRKFSTSIDVSTGY